MKIALIEHPEGTALGERWRLVKTLLYCHDIVIVGHTESDEGWSSVYPSWPRRSDVYVELSRVFGNSSVLPTVPRNPHSRSPRGYWVQAPAAVVFQTLAATKQPEPAETATV